MELLLFILPIYLLTFICFFSFSYSFFFPSIVSTQMQSPDDYNCLRPINHTPVDREGANGCADKNCEISEAPAKDNGADTSTEQAKLICSQNCTSKVQQDSLQVGVSNGNEGLQLVENGVPSSGSHRQGRAKPHKMALKKDCLEIEEEPVKEFDEVTKI